MSSTHDKDGGGPAVLPTAEPPAGDPPAEGAAEEEEPRLLPAGNALRYARGPVAIVLGALLTFVIMSIQRQFRWGVPLAALGVGVASLGVLDLLGTFDDPDEKVAHTTTLRRIALPVAAVVGCSVATGAFIILAVAGYVGILGSALLITTAFLATVVSVYRVGWVLGAWSTDETGKPRPLHRRHGFWLVTVTTLLYLPMLGSHSLSDPWETHYGEVAREILARNDWISLWWAQDGWFWSKPIFDFWIQAVAMATFGVRYAPGEMLSAAAEGRTPWPEWAVRMPIFLLTLVAGYLLYKAVANIFGRRAGLLGGLVLATMPQWFLVSHQTMTDMPFVATMSSAMALFLLGIHTDPDREARVYEVNLGITRLRLSAYHLVFGMIVAFALPQILYLFSRNFEIRLSEFGFYFHADKFMSGSAVNCGLPGNEACRPGVAVAKGLTPALQALMWTQALGVLLYVNWGERRVQRLFFHAAWFFAAMSSMAKGPAGIGLPVLCILAYVLVTRRYRDLLRVELVSGVLIFLVVAMPWFVAMYARHGQPFTDRLLFHDMFKRAFTHVHDTNEGDDVSFRYYLWQLGYATFPWTGLVPAGLVWWLRRRDDGVDRRGDGSVFLAMWFLFAFSLFTLMLTKFHHYILPAVPPTAMLTGVVLDDMLRRFQRRSPDDSDTHRSPAADGKVGGGLLTAARLPLYLAGLGVGTVAIVAGLASAIPRWAAALASVPKTEPMSWTATLALLVGRAGWGAVIVVGGLVVLIAAATYLGRPEALAEPATGGDDAVGEEVSARLRYERILLGAVGVAAAPLLFFVGRDMASPREGQPSQVRLLHLFTYNYKRAWPPSLEFHHVLWAFVVVAAALMLLLAVARWRRHVVTSMVALGITFAAWGIDVYFVKTSPHWGQRETLIAYQRESASIPGPIMAYQMNWKGENFYAGNRIPAFVSSGKKFTDYILEEKKKGVKTFYFLTEHGRTSTLSNELGAPRFFDKLTTPEVNNKFVLVRARFE